MNTLSLLLVEDEPSIREQLAEVLSRRGFHVIEASSVKDAIDLIKTEMPHLIITDLCLDDGIGLSIAEFARDQVDSTEGLIIVCMTGIMPPDDAERAAKLCDLVVYKPFDLSLFLDTVTNLLTRPLEKLSQENMTDRHFLAETRSTHCQTLGIDKATSFSGVSVESKSDHPPSGELKTAAPRGINWLVHELGNCSHAMSGIVGVVERLLREMDDINPNEETRLVGRMREGVALAVLEARRLQDIAAGIRDAVEPNRSIGLSPANFYGPTADSKGGPGGATEPENPSDVDGRSQNSSRAKVS